MGCVVRQASLKSAPPSDYVACMHAGTPLQGSACMLTCQAGLCAGMLACREWISPYVAPERHACVPGIKSACLYAGLIGCGDCRSCAFKASSGQPAYYDGYQGAKYSSPKPSPAPVLRLPKASPAVVPKPARRPSPSPMQAPAQAFPSPKPTSPSPKPRSPSPSPSPLPSPSLSRSKEPTSDQPVKLPQPVLSRPLAATPKPSPSPPLEPATELSQSKEPTSAQPSKLPQPVLSVPLAGSPEPSTSPPFNTLPSPAPVADSGSIVCKCPDTVQADLDVDKIAALVAAQLWQKLADASK